MSSRARDFRPTRRRGFDDDNFEPPRRSFEPAPGFAAQRFEAPSLPPIQAVVRWYNPEKGFGFVQLADGSGDAFLHVSVVERSGHDSVPPGATLEVRAGPGPKGPQVTEIVSLDSSTAQQQPPRRGRPERPAYKPAGGAAVEEFGTVKVEPDTVEFPSMPSPPALPRTMLLYPPHSGVSWPASVAPIAWLRERQSEFPSSGGIGWECCDARRAGNVANRGFLAPKSLFRDSVS